MLDVIGIHSIYIIQKTPHMLAKDLSTQFISFLPQDGLPNILHLGPAFAAFNLWHFSHNVVQTILSQCFKDMIFAEEYLIISVHCSLCNN